MNLYILSANLYLAFSFRYFAVIFKIGRSSDLLIDKNDKTICK